MQRDHPNRHVGSRRLTIWLLSVGTLLLHSLAAGTGMPPARSNARQRSAISRPSQATTIAALRTFPAFFHAQRIRLRGELRSDLNVNWIERDEHRIVLLGSSRPATAPAGAAQLEAMGTFWDVGRLEPSDPRLAEYDIPAISQRLLGKDWPGIGELLAIAADLIAPAQPFPAPSVRSLALDPGRYANQTITVAGRFRGRNLYGDLPSSPGRSRWDFVLQSADAAIWITGIRPRGSRFDLNIDTRIDTGRWLEVRGVARHGAGLVWIEGSDVKLGQPAPDTAEPEAQRVALQGPPPEVVFSAPTQDETDVSPSATVRIQFSRDMKADSFSGHVRVRYLAEQSVERGEPQTPGIESQSRYDQGPRVLEIRFARPLERFRSVQVELTDGIEAVDRAPLKAWTLTFTVGG